MTPEELDKSYTRVISDMQGNPNGENMKSLGTTALILIRARIQEKGIDAEGLKYAPYSTNPMLANRGSMNVSAYNTIAGSKDKRRNLKWSTIDGHKLFEIPGGYKQFRELHGRQTGFVDFSFSGRMWANISLISNAQDHISGTAIIGAKNTDTNDILEGNTKRRGDILDLSKSEIEELKEQYTLNTLRIFKENGL